MTTATAARTPQALNKLMFVKLMPLLIIAYILSFLDRTNIALAKHHLDVDLDISAAAYGLGAGLFFLTYALSEIPSNLIMHKVGARFWIARIMVTWGLISAAMAFVQGETSFYVLRLLLGIAEAGLFPGVMLYLTYWFNREQRARATGYFLLGVCFANIIGGPVGAALMRMDGLLGGTAGSGCSCSKACQPWRLPGWYGANCRIARARRRGCRPRRRAVSNSALPGKPKRARARAVTR